MHYGLCTVHYGLYTMHYGLHTMHYGLHTMHYGLYTMQIQIAAATATVVVIYTDPTRTKPGVYVSLVLSLPLTHSSTFRPHSRLSVPLSFPPSLWMARASTFQICSISSISNTLVASQRLCPPRPVPGPVPCPLPRCQPIFPTSLSLSRCLSVLACNALCTVSNNCSSATELGSSFGVVSSQ